MVKQARKLVIYYKIYQRWLKTCYMLQKLPTLTKNSSIEEIFFLKSEFINADFFNLKNYSAVYLEYMPSELSTSKY